MQLDELYAATEDPQDRRRLPRMRFDCPMSFRPLGTTEDHRGFARSLSGTGLLFEAEEEIAPGTRLEVFARPPLAITQPLWAAVTVVRCELQTGTTDSYQVAAEIDQML